VHVETLTRPQLLLSPAVVELRPLVARLRWRLGLERLVVLGLRGMIASSVVLIGLSLALWLSAADQAWLWLAAAPLLTALGFGIVRWPSRIQTAVVADRRLGLQERLSTAVELSQAARAGRYDQVQIRDAVGSVAVAPRVWLALGTRTRNEALVAIGSLVLATALGVLLPNVARPISVPSEAHLDLADAAAPDAAADRAVPVDNSAANDQAASASARAQATPLPADLAARVQQEQAERTALDKLAQGLGSVSAGQGAAP
jgi:hypothetical protein